MDVGTLLPIDTEQPIPHPIIISYGGSIGGFTTGTWLALLASIVNGLTIPTPITLIKSNQ